MFKKSNRNFRAKRNDSESENEKSQSDDEHSNSNSAIPSTKAPSNGRNGSQVANSLTVTTKSQVRPTQPVLTFDDLEGDSKDGEEEEFRVKKSKESRRIAKEVKRSKKERERQLKYGTSEAKPDTSKAESNQKASADLSSDFQEDSISDLNIKFKPLKKAPEASTNESDTKRSESDKSQSEESGDEETKLRKLREEIAFLNGDEDPIENESDETKRSMKLMLRNGIIPDASVIFAARKKREMARQEDFIPVGKTSTNKFKSSSKSRVVREDDDNDFSDEESAASSRLNMNYIEAEKNELRANRENFLAYEHGDDYGDSKSSKKHSSKGAESDENSDVEMSQRDPSPNGRGNDDDSEEDRWEAEQIRKGVLISQTNATNLEFETFTNKKLNLARKLGPSMEPQPMDSDNVHFDMTYLNSMPKIKFAKIKESLKENMAILNESLKTCKIQAEQTELNLKANKSEFEKHSKVMPVLNEQYIYFQKLREKINEDPAACTEETIKEFKEAKAKWLALIKQ